MTEAVSNTENIYDAKSLYDAMLESLKTHNTGKAIIIIDKLIDADKNGTKPDFDINETYDGKSALGSAANLRLLDVVEKMLTISNIDINAQSKTGLTPLMKAFTKNPNSNPTVAAIINKLLSRPEIDVDLQDNNHDTALYLACKTLNLDAVQKILEKSTATINVMSTDPETGKLTPLYATIIAATEDDEDLLAKKIEIVRKLLGVPEILINTKNSGKHEFKDNTALIRAASKGLKPIVELLLERPQLEIDAKNAKGTTALDAAIECESRMKKVPYISQDVKQKNLDLIALLREEINRREQGKSTLTTEAVTVSSGGTTRKQSRIKRRASKMSRKRGKKAKSTRRRKHRRVSRRL